MVGLDTLLQDRYRLTEKLAVGGMGTVYRARDEKLDRDVAIKLLAPNLAEDESFVERFRREARAAAGLRHPNVANVFDAGDEDGAHFIVMELAEGRDLARVLREEGPLDPDRAVKVISQICLALGHAHAAGIVHRDVKPANVIVGDDDSVKVTDFGIARAADDSKLTVTGSVLGTAQYISPEQAEGKTLSPASDIYSLGIVLFETLTGAVPYTGDSLMAVAMRHINDTVPLPSTLSDSVPPELDRVAAKATAKDPKDRFHDTAEMHQALAAALMPDDASTAVLPAGAATEQASTVWPIPGDRWDPVSLGRKVLLVFGILAFIAIALLIARVVGTEPLASSDRDRATQRAGSTTGNFTLPSNVIGTDYESVQEQLSSEGYDSEVVFLEGDPLARFIAQYGVDEQDAEADEVIGSDPPPGTAVEEGRTITLFVSTGSFSEDKGHGPPDKAKGHDKKEKD